MTPEIELEEDLAAEPIDQARILLAEVIRLGTIDVGRFPSSASVRANLARSLLNAGELDHAEREARIAIELEPGNRIARSVLGHALAGQRRVDEARAAFEGVLAIDPDDVEALHGIADVATRDGRFDDAANFWRQLDELLRDSAVPSYYLGLLMLRSKAKASVAIAYLKTAIRRNPRWAPAYHALGAAYSLNSQPEKAARAFRIAVQLDPTMSEAVHALATALIQANQREAALAELEKGTARHPHDYRLRELLAGIHIQDERFHQARTQLYAALQELRESGEDRGADAGRLANNLGVCYVQTRDWLEADQAFTRSMELAPGSLTVPGNNLGLLRMDRRDFDGARAALRNVEDAGQADEDTFLLTAESHMREGQWREALEVYRRAVESGQADWRIFANLGATLTDSAKKPEEAMEVLRDALSMFPTSDIVRNNLAYAALMASDLETARFVLDEDDQTRSSSERGQILLTATRGLLAFREARLDEGALLYDEAAGLAKGMGDLAREIRQKKHLEYARAFQRAGNDARAVQEVRAGLGVVGRPIYRSDLEDLARDLGLPVPTGDSREIRRSKPTQTRDHPRMAL